MHEIFKYSDGSADSYIMKLSDYLSFEVPPRTTKNFPVTHSRM